MKLKHVLASAVALLCSVGVWSQPTASTPVVGNTYYLYNPMTKLFMTTNVNLPFVRPTGSAWTIGNAAGHDGWITLRLKDASEDGKGYFWGKWWANNPNQDYSSYSDETVYQLVNVSGSNYKLKSYAWGATESYIYINTGNEKDCSFRLACNSHEQAGLDEGYTIWQFISEEDYVDYMTNDYTSKIDNNDFLSGTSGWTLEGEGNKQKHGNTAIEYWNKAAASGKFDYYQSISLPAGKYVLRAAMYNSTNGESGASFDTTGQCGVYGTSNGVTKNANVTVDGTAYNIYTTDELLVPDGNLRLGFKNSTTMTARWFGADWIQLTCTEYCLSAAATELPTNGALAPDKWYYYTLPTSDEYEFTLSAAATLTYSQDGTQFISEATGTNESFTGDQTKTFDLSAGRVYIKSSAATTLSVSYKYNIGAATADKAYVQSGNTVTVSFAASTNDPAAVLSQDYSGVTFNSAAIACTPTASGFTFTVPDELTAGSAYTLSIPANAIGYAAGSIYNDAQNITFTTGVVTDGTYYFKEAGADRFLTRGGNYGTEGVTCIHGINFELTMQTEDGSYFVKNVDHSLAAGSAKYLNAQYTDQGSMKYFFESAGDGYYYMKKSASEYVKIPIYDVLAIPYGYIATTTNVEEATKWQLMSASEYNTYLAGRQTNQITAIAAAAGLTATSASELEEALVSHSAVNRTGSISNADLSVKLDGWATKNFSAKGKGEKTPTVKDGAAEVYDGTGGVSQEITGLSAGLYKVTVDAFFRMGDGAAAGRVGSNANILAYVSASTPTSSNLVQIKNWYDYDGSRPTNRTEFCNVAENYRNTLYVYVSEGETLTLTLGTPGSVKDSWMPFRNWTLTYYTNDPVQANKDYIAAQKGDITGLINGDFQINDNGWTNGSFITWVKTQGWKGADSGNNYYERASDGTMSYTVANMPAGTYKVVAAARSYDGGKLKAQVADGDFGVELTGVGNAAEEGRSEINTNGVEMPYSSLGGFTTDGSGHNWHWITATGTLAEDGDLVINFHTTGKGWMAIDDVHLYCTELDGTSYTRTVGDGKETINTSNSVVTADIIMNNPNTILNSTGKVTTAAGQDLNNNQYDSDRITKLVLYDGYDFTNSGDAYGLDNGATLYRNIPANTWCTLVVPFYPSNLDAKLVPSELSAEGVLSFVPAAEKDMNDAPMLVKSTAGVTAITGSRNGTTGIAKGDMTSGAGATMKGTYSAIINDVPRGSYVVARKNDADALYKVNGAVSLAPFRAYFTVPDAGVKANIITLNLDGTETAIECIDNVQTTKGNDVIYNLAGQRLSKMQKGVNIVNGKKIFVK